MFHAKRVKPREVGLERRRHPRLKEGQRSLLHPLLANTLGKEIILKIWEDGVLVKSAGLRNLVDANETHSQYNVYGIRLHTYPLHLHKPDLIFYPEQEP